MLKQNLRSMSKLKASQRKEWAKTLYVSEGLSQKEISERTGISTVTINKYVNENDGEWKRLRQSMLVTREQQLQRIYLQIQELNNHIYNRPEGQRFANSKEADSLSKLTVAARTLENDTSVADIIEVSKQVLAYIRQFLPEKAEEMARIFDEFIKNKLRR